MQNDTNSKVYEAHDGTNDVRRWMKINEYDGMDHLNIWNTKYGNMINGTDGYGFAPFSVSPPDIFIDLLCRSFHLSLPAEISERKYHTKTKFILSWDAFGDTFWVSWIFIWEQRRQSDNPFGRRQRKCRRCHPISAGHVDDIAKSKIFARNNSAEIREIRRFLTLLVLGWFS